MRLDDRLKQLEAQQRERQQRHQDANGAMSRILQRMDTMTRNHEGAVAEPLPPDMISKLRIMVQTEVHRCQLLKND
jgi:hypothetical protein